MTCIVHVCVQCQFPSVWSVHVPAIIHTAFCHSLPLLLFPPITAYASLHPTLCLLLFPHQRSSVWPALCAQAMCSGSWYIGVICKVGMLSGSILSKDPLLLRSRVVHACCLGLGPFTYRIPTVIFSPFDMILPFFSHSHSWWWWCHFILLSHPSYYIVAQPLSTEYKTADWYRAWLTDSWIN